ncbi:hypothetical protein SRS16CHR_02573 [Variovorax sp. SRS16]|uniref:hypothetical protein n=1 Tax=Variovorax sp. SRS16 TaxID=282217 RepID=UPI0013163C1D|nr:hypothetical protein [Variovorax sp. SRS16]VTU20092.1 hypothetical protein SRS16CHR_02573 [Variovorax sp. SRS16]
MLNGLGRLSAAIWGFVGLWVFWLLASVCFSAKQAAGENLKGALVLVSAMAIVYGLHRVTCWVMGGFAQPKGAAVQHGR